MVLELPVLSGSCRAGSAALIAIHPLGADKSFWDAIEGRIPGVDLLRYDLPGHGMSPTPAAEYTIADLGEQVIGLMDESGLAEASLVGVSIGGLVAQYVAGRYPDRVDRIALIDTVAVYPSDVAANLTQRSETVRRLGMEPIVEPTLAMWFSAEFRESGNPIVTRTAQVLRAMDPESYARACDALVPADMTDLVARISAPVLVMCGDDDSPAFTEAAVWLDSQIPDSRLVWLTGGRHGAALECSHAMINEFVQFFGKAVARRQAGP